MPHESAAPAPQGVSPSDTRAVGGAAGRWLGARFHIALDPPAPQRRSRAADALKWIALATMTVDHLHAAFGGYAYPWVTAVGRIAWPLFALVFAWNLARAGEAMGARARPIFVRLTLAGLAAQPAYMLMNGLQPWANIMGTFAVALGCLLLASRAGGRTLRGAAAAIGAVVLFLVGGAVVDHFWFGVALVLAAWIYWRDRTRAAALLLALVLAVQTAFIATIVGPAALGALAAVPLALTAHSWGRWAPQAAGRTFYVYYAAHLWAIALAVLALGPLA